ncbi:unnamed protein product [Spirodela intermedia]|uniref:Uncharacterized protein n=1 Tax=Spirodela intermedia TaxID=51605 RepID=A0A7I8KEM3_SPIIN|nr:unnamed protein product [Spirodela intermedia]
MVGGTTESDGDDGRETPSWRSSWTLSRGSLRDTICVETSESILEDAGVVDGDGAVCVSGGQLLTRPVGRESDPCEITVCFRERHEIHRVYVRSTARVFEIYYGLEEQDGDNEYLCTVRCGPTEKEVLLPRFDGEEEHLKDSNASIEAPGKTTKGENNTSSEEDGWVEVKVPESPLLGTGSDPFSDNKDGTVKANGQIYFEATAEISDASPCMSLKIRLLSLQAKEWIHIEEVYIYADPVESTDSRPPLSKGEDMAGNSLLAMLVPGILQLSKPGSSRVHDTAASFSSAVQKHGNNGTKGIEEMKPETAKSGLQKICSTLEGQEHKPTLVPIESSEIITRLTTENSGLRHVPGSSPEKDNGISCLEKKLDEIVSRMGRMEDYLSRFEENILKPLSCIDTRLQQVERQLDALSSRGGSSRPLDCSRISAPEFQIDECDSDGGFGLPDLSNEDATVSSLNPTKEGETVNTPEVVKEYVTVDDQHVGEKLPNGNPVLAAAGGEGFPSASICPGLLIKAPDFPNEEDEHVSSSDISGSAVIAFTKVRAPFSIDDALTSALEAFMLSGSTNSPKNKIDSDLTSQASDEADHNPSLDGNFSTGIGGQIKDTIVNETNGVHSVDLVSAQRGKGQEASHLQQWSRGISGGLVSEEDVSNDQFLADDVERESGNGWGDDVRNREDALAEFPCPTRGWKKWDGSGSSDSTIDANETENLSNMDLSGENSMDLANQLHTLHNQFNVHEDDYELGIERLKGAGVCDDPNSVSGDRPMEHTQDQSKEVTQQILNAFLGSVFKVDSQQVSHTSQEESILDVKFVRHEESEGSFHFDALVMDMADPGVPADDSMCLNGVGTAKQYDSGSAEITDLGASPTGECLLIDLEVAVNDDSPAMEGSHNQQPLSSLI